MRKLNLIVVFNKDLNKVLFCIREKGKNLTKEIVDKVIEQVQRIGVETIN